LPILENPELSVVIPVHNEMENILPLSNKLLEVLQDFSSELIFVDDGSTDGTIRNIKAITNSRIILVELNKRFGQSIALARGIEIARGKYIVTIDGDLQNDPKDIPKLLELIQTNQWDLITGIRMNRQDNIIRTVPSVVANAIVRFSTRLRVKDLGCGLKVFNAELAKSLPFYGEQHRYITLIAHLKGARISETPISHHPRLSGASKYNLGRTFRVVGDLMIILLQNKNLKLLLSSLGLIGGIFFAIGCAVGLYLVFLSPMQGTGSDIYWIWIGMLNAVFGLHLFGLGLLYKSREKSFEESIQGKVGQVKTVTTLYVGS
jgi:glycosyltransferase involved in cell wall biosynthesis